MQNNILVSACLLGINCRYNGIEKSNKMVCELLNEEEIHLIPVCPEQLGGLSTPRMPSEITFEGKVMRKDGRDVTEEYRRGAEETLKIAQLYHCSVAILKERSPSCGCGEVYDGTFSGTLAARDGVTAALMKENGIEVFGESDIENGRKFW